MVLPLLFAGLAKAGAAIAASSLTAPLLGLAGTAIGAAADNKARKTADYNNSPQGIRDRAEAAGFNPLVFAGPGTGTGAQYAPTMGHTIASGLAAVGDQLTQVQQLRLQAQQLEQENQRLTELTQRQTLQPAVPGVYQRQPERPEPDGTMENPYPGFAYYTTMAGELIAGPAPGTGLDLDERLEWTTRETVGAATSTPDRARNLWESYRQTPVARFTQTFFGSRPQTRPTQQRRPETFTENFDY